MQQFSRDFAGDATVHIPRGYPELSTAAVLSMERVEGIKLSDTAGLKAAGIDPEEVARRGVHLYLEMIFAHNFYHADPHPGNVVLMAGGVIGLLDFGMVGRLDERLQEDIEEMVMAVAGLDAQHLTSIIVRVGAVPAELDRAALSVDVADFISYYGNQSLEDFDLGGALREMIEIIRRYHISLPARITMLIKVLVSLEGTSRLLSPRFSLLDAMRPYRTQMLMRRLSPRRKIRKLRRFYAEMGHLIEVLPQGLMDIVQQVQNGKFDVHLEHRGLEPSVNRLVLGMLAIALFLGSSMLVATTVPPAIGRVSLPGAAGCLVSIALGWWLWRAINKSGRLVRRK